MNFCTRCGSHYERPGTCNCFAQMQPVIPAPLPLYVPTLPYRPWWEAPSTAPYPTTWPSPWYTYTTCSGSLAPISAAQISVSAGATAGTNH